MSVEKLSLDLPVLAALSEELSWTGRPRPEDLARLPGCAAVYLLLAAAGAPVQLATTQHLRRLAIARLLDQDRAQRGRADLAEVTRGVRWRRVHSAFEGRWWYYRIARAMYPKQYRHLIGFGPAWFLHVDWQWSVPEIAVTEHIWQAPGDYAGPWLTHDTCQKALEGLWDLFDLCRYPDQVQRAPAGQRCAYADMGRCDAPCDGSVPLDHYLQRCRAAWDFACGGVRAWIDDAKRRMKLAASEQRFEHAAQIKHQLAFAWKWHDRWLSLVRTAEHLNHLLVIPVTRRRAWKLFWCRQGALVEGPIHTDRTLSSGAVAWLAREQARESLPLDPMVRMEQTWLVSHFMCSKEGDASLVRPLAAGEQPPELENEVRQWLAARRSVPRVPAGAGEDVPAESASERAAPTDQAR